MPRMSRHKPPMACWHFDFLHFNTLTSSPYREYGCCEHTNAHRMDRDDLEPHRGSHEGLTRLQNCHAENLVRRVQAMSSYTPPSDAWLGGAMEDRGYGIPRMDYLRQVPAAIRLLPTALRLEDLYRLDLTDIHRGSSAESQKTEPDK